MTISGNFPLAEQPDQPDADPIGWGDWGNLPYDDSLDSLFGDANEVEVYTYPSLIQQLEVAKHFLEEQGWQLGDNSVITYHGSAANMSLSEVFGKEVIHIDPDDELMESLRKEGLVALTQTFEEYINQMPEDTQIGLLFLYNSVPVDEAALRRVQQGGVVMANNWHGYANEMMTRESFELLAVIENGTNRTVTGDEATMMSGTQTHIIQPGGMINTNPSADDIEAARDDPLSVVETVCKNTENVWIFRKKKASE